jgi:hypothetical protein
MFTIWANSRQARSSSPPHQYGLISAGTCPADRAPVQHCRWCPCSSAAPACCRHEPGGSRKRCGPAR